VAREANAPPARRVQNAPDSSLAVELEMAAAIESFINEALQINVKG
jgi:hypothetical protein